MARSGLPIGCSVRIEKPDLQAVIDRLLELGYRVVGPRVSESAVVLGEIRTLDDLPIGISDVQEAGKYRLERRDDGMYFNHVVGPNSLKELVFPPQTTLLTCRDQDGRMAIEMQSDEPPPVAVLGARACDLHALQCQDRIFLGDRYVNPDYLKRRQGLFLIAVNCSRAAETCFCTSTATGPAVASGFDLCLTEMSGHFLVEVGTERGGDLIAAAPWRPCSTREVIDAQQVPRRAEQQMEARRHPSPGQPKGRHLETAGLRELLLANLEHDEWAKVGERCLACGNCTMVCPTCFCSRVDEVNDLLGGSTRRVQCWDSCFTAEHSYMNSGTVRKATSARYRQWLTHKLATWHDQFGSSGCVGCGRCITWCPVGIDLTAEVAAIRGGNP
ncbi:MAG: 4Fe-4S dicluster domain-containing protein [Isosphaeraceae bacterium]